MYIDRLIAYKDLETFSGVTNIVTKKAARRVHQTPGDDILGPVSPAPVRECDAWVDLCVIVVEAEVCNASTP